jgi:hypothetical protein
VTSGASGGGELFASTVKTKHRYGKGGGAGVDDASSIAGVSILGDDLASSSHKLYAVLAEAWVCKESELGVQEATTYHSYTHLGHILHAGDVVMGYDLKHSTKFSGLQSDCSEDAGASNAGTGKRGRAGGKAVRAMGASSKDGEYNEFLLGRLPYELPDVVLVQKQTLRRGNGEGAHPSGGATRRRGRRRRATGTAKGAESAEVGEDDYSVLQDGEGGGEEDFSDEEAQEGGVSVDDYFREFEDGDEPDAAEGSDSAPDAESHANGDNSDAVGVLPVTSSV